MRVACPEEAECNKFEEVCPYKKTTQRKCELVLVVARIVCYGHQSPWDTDPQLRTPLHQHANASRNDLNKHVRVFRHRRIDEETNFETTMHDDPDDVRFRAKDVFSEFRSRHVPGECELGLINRIDDECRRKRTPKHTPKRS